MNSAYFSACLLFQVKSPSFFFGIVLLKIISLYVNKTLTFKKQVHVFYIQTSNNLSGRVNTENVCLEIEIGVLSQTPKF